MTMGTRIVSQRKLQRWIETISETDYKGYIIQLRTYPLSGITAKAIKVTESGQKVEVLSRKYNFRPPAKLISEMKGRIDQYEENLLIKLKNK